MKTEKKPTSAEKEATEIRLQYGSAAFVLPTALIGRLGECKDSELRVLLLLAAEEGLRSDFSPAVAAARLGLPEAEITAAVSFWRGCGILRTATVRRPAAAEEAPAARSEAAADSGDEKPAVVLHRDGVPHYTGAELTALLNRRSDLNSLLGECQKISGKLFNQAESNKILALADSYGLSAPYIMLLFQHCKDKDKGAAPYVYRVALTLYEQNIRTVEALTDYLTAEEARAGFEAEMRRLFGIGTRTLSSSESRFFAEWQTADYGEALIRQAFDMAVASTGSARPAYINKMLLNWRQKNIRTPEEAVAEADAFRAAPGKGKAAGIGGGKKNPPRRQPDESGFSSFAADEFFTAALRDSRAKYDGLTEEEMIRLAKDS